MSVEGLPHAHRATAFHLVILYFGSGSMIAKILKVFNLKLFVIKIIKVMIIVQLILMSEMIVVVILM
jgi:hypothetical protein